MRYDDTVTDFRILCTVTVKWLTRNANDPTADSVPVRNTHVATKPEAECFNVCAAIFSPSGYEPPGWQFRTRNLFRSRSRDGPEPD